jgi:hypothetical protein
MSTQTQIETWVKRLGDVTERVVREFENLSEEQLNQKLAPEAWSIAENLQHLIQINESYYPVIEKVREGNLQLGWMAHFAFVRNFFGKMILGSVESTRKKKIKTFPIWEPSHSGIEEGIVERFSAHQHHFGEFVRSCQVLIENGQVIYSPANDKVVYTLEQAFEIIVTHEERHLNQALEVRESLS